MLRLHMRMNCGENTIAGPVFKIASDKRELLEIKNNEIIHRKPINNHLQGNAMTIHNSLSELIGNTPLVKLNRVTDGIKAASQSKSNISILAAPPKTALRNASSTRPNAAANSSRAV